MRSASELRRAWLKINGLPPGRRLAAARKLLSETRAIYRHEEKKLAAWVRDSEACVQLADAAVRKLARRAERSVKRWRRHVRREKSKR